MLFLKLDETGRSLRSGPQNLDFFLGAAPARIYLPRKAHRGRFNVPHQPTECEKVVL
jgi:hypothetical protein